MAPRHLLYGTISTGHKSGGFNDTILEGVPATTYRPEKVTVYELGSKNIFDLNLFEQPTPLKLNGSFFYYDYSDQIFEQLVATGGTGGAGSPTATLSYSLQNYNLANSSIYGAEFETGLALPYDFRLDVDALFLHTEVTSGSIVDYRAEDYSNVGATPNISLKGNRLPLASEVTINTKISKSLHVFDGRLDLQGLIAYRSNYYLSIFNQKSQPLGFPGTGSTDAVAAGYGDLQDGFATINLAASYKPDGARWRVEVFGSNITNEEASQKAILGPQLNIRFLNDPRLYGVRLHVDF